METERSLLRRINLPEGRGYVFLMSDRYLTEHSPQTTSELVNVLYGYDRPFSSNQEAKKWENRDPAKLLVLGAGPAHREVYQPLRIGRKQKISPQRPVEIVCLDRQLPQPQTLASLQRMVRSCPHVTNFSYQEMNLLSLPGVQDYIDLINQLLTSGVGDILQLASISLRYRLCPELLPDYLRGVTSVSLQGVLDYLRPVEATALLLYVLRAYDLRSFFVRLAHGNLAEKHLSVPDLHRIAESSQTAQAYSRKTIAAAPPITIQEFLQEGIISLNMTEQEKIAANLTPDYPGTHILPSYLYRLLKFSSMLDFANLETESWVSNEDGSSLVLSHLITASCI